MYMCNRRSHIRARLVAARINGYGRRARGGCWKKEEVAIANPRVRKGDRDRERDRGERRPARGRAGLNAFVFAFTSVRLAGNTAVRPNCHRATSVYRRIPRK